jgi:hypothetical protein
LIRELNEYFKRRICEETGGDKTNAETRARMLNQRDYTR